VQTSSCHFNTTAIRTPSLKEQRIIGKQQCISNYFYQVA